MISPGLVLASMMYNVSLDQVSTFLIGLFVLLTGTGTFFTAAAATVWGKRPVFVISVVILLLTNIWGYFSMVSYLNVYSFQGHPCLCDVENFASLSAMRIVQGLASAPMETLVTSTVSDIFFVHERGQKLAIWGVMITSGVLLGCAIFDSSVLDMMTDIS